MSKIKTDDHIWLLLKAVVVCIKGAGKRYNTLKGQ